MDVWEVSRRFSETADMLEIKGDDGHRSKAYRRAAHSISRLTTKELHMLANTDRLETIPGVGPVFAGKISELMKTGTMELWGKLRAELPQGISELLGVPGLGPRSVAALYGKLGIGSIADLEQAIDRKQLEKLTGFGLNRVEKIKRGIKVMKQRQIESPLGVVMPVVRSVVSFLHHHGIDRVAVAGDIRLAKRLIQDITLVVQGDEQAVSSALADEGIDVVERSDIVVARAGGKDIALICADSETFAGRLLMATGPGSHVFQLTARAQASGYEDLMALVRQQSIDCERDLYRALGLTYIPPELRASDHVIDRAINGDVWDLVEVNDIAGDLHIHTCWSHGLHDIDDMVATAKNRGYDYMAVTDHSQSLVMAGGLSQQRLQEQIGEVERINEGSKMKVFTGSEVDILPDGSLDYPDDVLFGLDVVIASVHSSFSMSKSDMTRRIISAIRHPSVSIIGHLTGSILGYRRGYDVDVDVIIDNCAQYGTALEINSSGERLDVSPDIAARAVARGAYVAINTDAHSAGAMQDIDLGVKMARRGEIGPSHVINSWSLQKITDFLAGNHDR